MKRLDFYHRPKSEMAYAKQNDTIEIIFKAPYANQHRIEIIYGDPFMWQKNESGTSRSWASKKTTMNHYLNTSDHQFYIQSLNLKTKRVKYAFLIDERYLYGSKYLIDIKDNNNALSNLDNFFNYPYILTEDMYHAPKWVENTKWYSIFPDRFHRFNDNQEITHEWNSVQHYNNRMIFGGNIQGIIAKLDYIKSLGFNGIYLTPIFKAGSSHKYDTIDYFDIDPQFGTKKDFKQLVDELHQRNMKIMIDAVFNHVSYHHPFFQDIVEKEENSKYFDYFYIHSFPCTKVAYNNAVKESKQIPYESFAFTPNMPKLNTSNPNLRQYLLNVATYWIENFDIDGWRLDVSNEISHDFWRSFRKKCKAVKDDLFILGENWDNSYPWLAGDQHDGVMNYEFTFSLWQFYDPSNKLTYNANDLKDALVNTIVSYPKIVLNQLFNLLDSHDTKRIFSVLDKNMNQAKQIYAFMALLPGMPSIFYGSEIPLEGNDDPDNRRCMPWNEANEGTYFQTFIQSLFKAYSFHQGFSDSNIEFNVLSDDVIIVRKPDLIGIFNRGESTFSLRKSINGIDVLNDTFISINLIEANSFKILSLK